MIDKNYHNILNSILAALCTILLGIKIDNGFTKQIIEILVFTFSIILTISFLIIKPDTKFNLVYRLWGIWLAIISSFLTLFLVIERMNHIFNNYFVNFTVEIICIFCFVIVSIMSVIGRFEEVDEEKV
jgi:hypothetical protein